MKKFFLLASLATALSFTACNNGGGDATTSPDAKKDSASTAQADKEARNKKIALESVNAFLAGNIDEALKDIAPDATDYFDGSMPPVKGADSIKAGLKTWSAAFGAKGDNIEAYADGNTVVVYGDWTYTWKGDFMGAKANGKSASYKDVDIFTFSDDGKVTSHRSIYPSGAAMAAMGVPMPK